MVLFNTNLILGFANTHISQYCACIKHYFAKLAAVTYNSHCIVWHIHFTKSVHLNCLGFSLINSVLLFVCWSVYSSAA